MIDCDKVKEYVSDYIEKRLTPGLKTELDNHFHLCPDCKLVLERIPKVQSLMGNLVSVQCSSDFNLKLRARIAGSQNDSVVSKNSIKKLSYGFSFAIFILSCLISPSFSFNASLIDRTNSSFVFAIQITLENCSNSGRSVATTGLPRIKYS